MSNVRTEVVTEYGSRPEQKSNKKVQPGGQRTLGFKSGIEPDYSVSSALAGG